MKWQMKNSWGQEEENRTISNIYISTAHQAMLWDIDLIADYSILLHINQRKSCFEYAYDVFTVSEILYF